MARMEVTTHVEAPPERVWDVLVDWEVQPEWMVDARSVQVEGTRREGEGVQLACRTNIAFGIEVDDALVVTGWEPGRLLAVSHEGTLVQGAGAFELTPTGQGTVVVWWEEFSVPLGAVGEAIATVSIAPWARRVCRRSLARLKRRAEQDA